MSDNGRVKFTAVGINKSFICWLGTDGAKPTGGYGGWDLVDRPRRLALTQWNGRNPLSMDVSILFDGYADDNSIEEDCAKLEAMAFNDDFNPPPIVQVTGDAVPHQLQKWVITNISWGGMIRRQRDGERLRQEATVSIVRYVAADKLQLRAADLARRKIKTTKPPKTPPEAITGTSPD